VDYTELDAASNRGVDEVQSLLEQAVYKPVQGRFKVFMIDEVHMLTNTAFNAMLKTLEEPPEYLKFVLATTDPQKVPVTVLSRCLQFNLRPMAPETVFEHLTQVLAAEQLNAEPLALRLLARAARGSMRDALSLADQAIAFGNGQLQEAGVRQMLGSVDRSHVMHMISALTEGDGASVVNQVNALRLQGVSAAATLEDMAILLQRMAVMQMVPSMAQDGDDPDTQGLAALAQAMSAEETQLLYSLCLHGRTELGLAPDEYAALTMVLLRLLAFKPQAGVAEKKSPLISAKPRAEAASPTESAAPVAAPTVAPIVAPTVARIAAPISPPTAVQPAAPVGAEPPPWEDWPDTTDHAGQDPLASVPAVALAPSAPVLRALPVREAPEPSARLDMPRTTPPMSVQATPEGDVWLEVVQGLLDPETITALVRELALQSQLMGRESERWQLRVERETLNHEVSRDRLQAALQAAGHGDVTLHIEIGPVTDSPAKRLAVKAAEKMLAAQELIQNDPLVQAMVRDFGAKIVPGSIQLI
jgi:DNA polymerase-3 subunit gamma/tau